MAVDVSSSADLLTGEELAHLREEPARAAVTVPLPDDLPGAVRTAIGVPALYAHQRAAWDAAARGEHLIVTTGTASGKTLAFNLPVLSALATEPKSRVLYLYPTKALAQDQFRTLGALALPGLKPAIYDGDTPTEHRAQIRRWANAILTNPDMVHIGLLPHHDRWGDVLANLAYVVVDEAHVYRGVFGSHVGNVLRRLRRVARIYGAEPQFLLASATISNPGELGRALLGAPVTVVGEDGAPRAERTVALWNPPLLDVELGLRGSALAEAAKLQAGFVERGLRTLTFTKSRKAAELVHRFTAERLGDDSRLSPYRAGYTAQQRREIERRLAAGELLGVSSTDALELGIDIGLLDAVISVGFPGTVASLRQQWGRAGRRGHGLAVLVATEDALDQYFMREPDKLLGRRVEAAILDHANPRVLAGHVRAAAFEAPLDEADADVLGPEALAAAAGDPELKRTRSGWVWAGRDYPAAGVPLRSADAEAFTIVDGGSGAVLGVVERSRAYSTVHAGAVYLHLGQSYLVEELDETALRAVVTPFSGDWYTQAKKETETAIAQPRRTEARCGLELVFGEIEVTEQVVGYERRTIRSQERIELVPLESPPSSYTTEAIWFCPEPAQLAGLERMPTLLSTLHAAEHALIAMLPLWAMCDRWDIGGLSTNVHPQTARPTVFVYDGHPGGVGITERGFVQFEDWVADTARMLAGCPCVDGCPSCVQSPKCGNLNEMLDKGGALTFLRRLEAAPVNWRAFGETFVTLLVITDPIGNAPIFLSVTRRLTPPERQAAAVRAVIAAGVLIVGFAIFGELVLRYLHVSIGSLSIAGGLLLLLVALEMLRGTDFPTGESEDVALVPLATPLVAGPGAIATAIVLWRSHPHLGGHVAVVLAIIAAVSCVGLTLLVAERLTRTLSPSIFSFLTRVFGLLLSAIAVQLVVNGVKAVS